MKEKTMVKVIMEFMVINQNSIIKQTSHTFQNKEKYDKNERNKIIKKIKDSCKKYKINKNIKIKKNNFFEKKTVGKEIKIIFNNIKIMNDLYDFEEMLNLLKENEIICLQETKHKNKLINEIRNEYKEININNNPPIKKNHGGIMTITKELLLKHQIKSYNENKLFNINIYNCIRNKKLIIINIYLPPYSNEENSINKIMENNYKIENLSNYFYEELTKFIKKYKNENNYIMIGGDFNTYLYLEEKRNYNNNYIKRNKLMKEFIEENELIDLWNKLNKEEKQPITYKLGNQESIIDYILVSKNMINENIIKEMKIFKELKLNSDHKIIEIRLNLKNLFKKMKYNKNKSTNLMRYTIDMQDINQINEYEENIKREFEEKEIEKEIKKYENEKEEKLSNEIWWKIIESIQESSLKTEKIERRISSNKMKIRKIITIKINKLFKILNKMKEKKKEEIKEELLKIDEKYEIKEEEEEKIKEEIIKIIKKEIKNNKEKKEEKEFEKREKWFEENRIKPIINNILKKEEKNKIKRIIKEEKIIEESNEIQEFIIKEMKEQFKFENEEKKEMNELNENNYEKFDDIIFNKNEKEYFGEINELIKEELKIKKEENIEKFEKIMDPIKIEEWNDYWRKKRNNKTGGISGVNINHIKKLPNEISELILRLINENIKNNHIFELFKYDLIIPISKNEENNEYRPLRMMEIFKKSILGIIGKRISKIIEENKMINDQQNGFRKKRGTSDSILSFQLLFDYLKITNKESHILSIDFSKAFDSVPWYLIYLSLRRIGIPQSFIKLIMKLRTENKQIVYHYENINLEEILKEIKNGNKLNIKNEKIIFTAEKGIQQGDDFSPLLWTLVSDILLELIENNIKNKFEINEKTKITNISYADDINFILKNKEELEKTIGLIEEFSKFSGIKINYKKSIYIPIIQNNLQEEYIIPNENNKIKMKIKEEKYKNIPILNINKKIKILGIEFEIFQILEDHLKEKYNKIKELIKIIKKIKLSNKLFYYIYEMIIIPKLNYSIQNVVINEEILKKIDIKLKKLINNKLKLSKSFPNNILYMPKELLGLNYTSIQDYNKYNKLNLINILIKNENENDNKIIKELFNENLRLHQIKSKSNIYYFNNENIIIPKKKQTLLESIYKIMNENEIKIENKEEIESIYENDISINDYLIKKKIITNKELNKLNKSNNYIFISDILNNKNEMKLTINKMNMIINKEYEKIIKNEFFEENNKIKKEYLPIIKINDYINMNIYQYKHIMIYGYIDYDNFFIKDFLCIGELINSNEIRYYKQINKRKELEKLYENIKIKNNSFQTIKYNNELILPNALIKYGNNQKNKIIKFKYCCAKKIILRKQYEDELTNDIIYEIIDLYNINNENEKILEKYYENNKYKLPRKLFNEIIDPIYKEEINELITIYNTNKNIINIEIKSIKELNYNSKIIEIVSDGSYNLNENKILSATYLIKENENKYGNFIKIKNENENDQYNIYRCEMLGIILSMQEIEYKEEKEYIHYLDNKNIINLFNKMKEMTTKEILKLNNNDYWYEIKYLLENKFKNNYKCKWQEGHIIKIELNEIEELQDQCDYISKEIRKKGEIIELKLKNKEKYLKNENEIINNESYNNLKNIIKSKHFNNYINKKSNKHPKQWIKKENNLIDIKIIKMIINKYKNNKNMMFIVRMCWDWLPTKLYKFKHNYILNNKCLKCNEIENYEHILLKCKNEKLIEIRNKFYNKIIKILEKSKIFILLIKLLLLKDNELILNYNINIENEINEIDNEIYFKLREINLLDNYSQKYILNKINNILELNILNQKQLLLFNQIKNNLKINNKNYINLNIHFQLLLNLCYIKQILLFFQQNNIIYYIYQYTTIFEFYTLLWNKYFTSLFYKDDISFIIKIGEEIISFNQEMWKSHNHLSHSFGKEKEF